MASHKKLVSLQTVGTVPVETPQGVQPSAAAELLTTVVDRKLPLKAEARDLSHVSYALGRIEDFLEDSLSIADC